MKTKLQFTAMIMLMAISMSFSAQNLVTNGGFETAALDGWTFYGADANGDANTGLLSARLKGNQSGLSRAVTVVPGTTYDVSFAGKWVTELTVPTSWFSGMSMAILNASDNSVIHTTALLTESTWTVISEQFTAPAGVTEIKVDFYRPKLSLPLMLIDDVSVTVATAAGINEIGALKANVYPNPASDVLNISASKELVSYTIFNVIGKKVKEGALKSSISLLGLSKGVFFLKTLSASGQVYTAKFIVK